MAVELRGGETLVAGETAAVNTFRDHHVLAAFARQVDQRLAFPKVLSAAGHVNGNRCFLRCELETIHQMRTNEPHRVIQIQANISHILHQPQCAGAGVAIDRIEPAATGLEQCTDQFLTLVLGLFGIAL